MVTAEKISKKCSKEVKEIAELINKSGGKIFIVGGFIRDLFLNKESKDIDIEIMGLTDKEIVEILKTEGKTKIAGVSFPVILYKNIEISVTESKYKGEESIRKSAFRRDFTINSIYFDIIENKIYDFFNGIEDIQNGIIRCVHKKNIEEDPLRILRAVQFHARFEFKIEEDTEKEMIKALEMVYTLPKERVFIEIEKILMKTEKPSTSFYLLKKIGWLKRVFPELDILESIEQGKKYHPEGNVFIHTMLALDNIPIEEREIDVMLAILFHDIGKAIVENIVDGDNIHFYGHDKAGAERVREVLGRITENKEILENIEKLIEYHMYPLQMQKELTSKSVKKIASKLNFEKLIKVHRADMGGKGIKYDTDYIENALAIYREIKEDIKPLIGGKELISLGIKPGVIMGEYIKKIYEAQVDEQFMTYEDGIEYTKKIIGR
jgi:tRNA nucleotidyltransferase (CCA-adding enzyme)